MIRYADKWTDAQLEELEKTILEIYRDAAIDLSRIIRDYYNGRTYVNANGEIRRTRSLAQRDAEFRKLVEAGERTEEEYRAWRLAQLGRGERFERMRDLAAQRMTRANQVAAKYMNDRTPGIYALNRNYEAYTIDREIGSHSWILFDEATVRRLIVEKPGLMPHYPPERAIERGIDLEWGRKQITRWTTSGIIKGDSIHNIAQNLVDNLTKMDYVAAVRAARTAVTSAQNGGRIDTYHAAEEMGIRLKKKWMSTLDAKTRESHRDMDGETIEIDGTFPNGCAYPGDPAGAPEETYNCRCTLVSVLEGHEYHTQRRAKNEETGEYEIIADMTYREWEQWQKERQTE